MMTVGAIFASLVSPDDLFIKHRQCRDGRTPGTNDCPARNPFSLLIGSFVIQES